VEAVICQRLFKFRSSGAGEPDLDFAFTDEAACPPAPDGSLGRSIYELEGGQLLYHSGTDVLTARFRESVRMTCNIAAGKTNYALRSPDERATRAASHILFTVPLIELLRRRGLYNLHAAGLCKAGDAVLLAGPSGAGKSTLTLAMTRAGWDYMGDDMLFFRPDCADMLGFHEGIDVFPDLAQGGGKQHIRPEAVFGCLEVMRARPRALLFPRVAHKVESVLTPMEEAEAFLELAPNVLMTDRAVSERHFRALADLSKRTPAFRLQTGTDLDDAERVIADLFKRLRR
jgi:hypothetical protein